MIQKKGGMYRCDYRFSHQMMQMNSSRLYKYFTMSRITAGAMSVAIQTKLQLRVLESPKLFALKFDIHEKLLRKVTNNDSNFLRSKYTSQRDADNMEFMTNAGMY